MTDEMAKKAIAKALTDFDGYDLDQGVAAIIAALHAGGFKILPGEPTIPMSNAGADIMNRLSLPQSFDIYRAMWDAAP